MMLLGCTKGEPTFELLGASGLPQLLFGGKKSLSLTTNSLSANFPVTGTCDNKISGAVASISALPGMTLEQMTSALQIDCETDGTFSFTIKSLADLGLTPTIGTTYTIEIRAQTTAGLSRASIIKLTYAQPLRPVMITAGSARPSDGTPTGFAAEVRVTHRQNPGTVTDGTPGGFSATIGVRAANF